MKYIEICNASQNNLKNLTLKIARGNFTVIAGPSGAGKTSLLRDTIYAETVWRLRQVAGESDYHGRTSLPQPAPTQIKNLPPAVYLDGSLTPNSTHTIASLLRLDQLLAQQAAAATRICPKCHGPVRTLTHADIPELICERFTNCFITIGAGLGLGDEIAPLAESICTDTLRQGYTRLLIGGEIYEIDSESGFKATLAQLTLGASRVDVLIDRLQISATQSNDDLQRLQDALQAAYSIENIGLCVQATAFPAQQGRPALYLAPRTICLACGMENKAPSKQLLSARSAINIMDALELPSLQSLPSSERSALLSTPIGNSTIRALLEGELVTFLDCLDNTSQSQFFTQILNALKNVVSLGLGFLSPLRRLADLTRTERLLLQLATQAASPIEGLLYLLDEPAGGLHPIEITRLGGFLKDLASRGHTIIAADNQSELIEFAERCITLGPSSGSTGGMITKDTSGSQSANDFRQQIKIEPAPVSSSSIGKLELKGCSKHNLQCLDLSLPLNQLTNIIGLSGSGKATLLLDTILPAIQQYLKEPGNLAATQLGNLDLQSISTTESLKRVVGLAATNPVTSTSSTVATFSGLMPQLAQLFAQLQLSRMRGLSPQSFLLITRSAQSGTCHTCGGRGTVKISSGTASTDYSTCPVCDGKRYRPEVLEVRYHGLSIAEVLERPIIELLPIFAAIPPCNEILQILDQLQLGALRLGQLTASLSLGELQRLTLARELKHHHTSTIFIFWQPSTGLHPTEVMKLLSIFHGLIKAGNTIVISDHHPILLSNANLIIELGPAGGHQGGKIIARGHPTTVVTTSHSVIGPHLKNSLRPLKALP